jgi:type IV secretion system protein VirD4
MDAGKTAKSILVSCGARLAPFDLDQVREITMYDELELDTLGDRKTALFLVMSDTDPTSNFLISMIYLLYLLKKNIKTRHYMDSKQCQK